MKGSDFITGWQTQANGGNNHLNSLGNQMQSSRYLSASGHGEESVTNAYNHYQDDQIDQVFEEMEDVESGNQTIMNEALSRIEQASLYQVLLNHNLLSPGSARQEILDKVQNEIKGFVLDRLEILLGMKQNLSPVTVKAELPFDDEEINALKALASRVLRKEPAPVSQPTVSPVSALPSIKMAPVITPVEAKKVPTPVAPMQKKKSAPIPEAKESKKPVKKPEGNPSMNVDLSNVSPEEAEEILKSRKPRRSAVGPTKPMAMPSAAVMAMKAQQQVQNFSGLDPALSTAIQRSLT